MFGADVAAAGLTEVGHPLLGAAVALADTGAVVLTGRLSRGAAPWLGDHRIGGAAVLPGTAVAEMVLRAGTEVGCPRIAELTLQRPLVVGDADVEVQLTVAGAAADGSRQINIFGRTAGTSSDVGPAGEWVLHAAGRLDDPEDGAGNEVDDASGSDDDWDTEGAQELDIEALHAGLAQAGIEYGPAFRGLQAAWRTPGRSGAGTNRHAGRPVRQRLRDPPRRCSTPPCRPPDSPARDGNLAPGLPFAFTGVTLAGTCATVLRARITRGPAGITLTLSDPHGFVVGRIQAVSSRELSAAEAAAPTARAGGEIAAGTALGIRRDHPRGDDRRGCADRRRPGPTALQLLTDPAASVPVVLAVRCLPDLAASPASPILENFAAQTFSRTTELLALLQTFLAAERFAACRIVLVTRGAVTTDQLTPVADLAGAALVGLARAAESENPGRLVLLDTDPATEADLDAAGIAGALRADEPQLALRVGSVLVPRLARPTGAPEAAPCLGPAGLGADHRWHRRARRPGRPTPAHPAPRHQPVAGLAARTGGARRRNAGRRTHRAGCRRADRGLRCGRRDRGAGADRAGAEGPAGTRDRAHRGGARRQHGDRDDRRSAAPGAGGQSGDRPGVCTG